MHCSIKNSIYCLFLISYFCLGIVSIVIGQIDINACDYTKNHLIDVNNLLIATGIGSVIFSCYYLFFVIFGNYVKISRVTVFFSHMMLVLHSIFILSWYICGYIVLLNSENILCLYQHSYHVIYATTTWFVMALVLLIAQSIQYYRIFSGNSRGYQVL